MVMLFLDGIDPNTIVGWLTVVGITLAALYRVGRWIVDLRSDVHRAIQLLEQNQNVLTRHERIILYILGHLGLDINKAIDEQ